MVQVANFRIEINHFRVMNCNRLLILSLLLCGTRFLFAQGFPVNNFDHYTKADGLSNNNITGIAQDATGYIWLSTVYGLNRYDGSRFLQYHSNSDSSSLASEYISGLTWLDKDRLAMYTSGLHIINTKTGETRNLFIPYHQQQYLYKFNMIMQARGDSNGDIFIVARSGFYHFDRNYNLLFRFDYYSEALVPTEHFVFASELFELDDHRLLIPSINGLYVYDKKGRQIKRMEAADCPVMAELLKPGDYHLFLQPSQGIFFVIKPGNKVITYINVSKQIKVISPLPFQPEELQFYYRSKLIAVNDTTFYLTGHSSGFYKMCFYPKSGHINFYPEKYFSSFVCKDVVKDKDNNLWVATDKGLFKQNPRKTQVELATLPASVENAFPNFSLSALCVTKNQIYAGARNQQGLILFDKETMHYKSRFLLQKKVTTNNPINAIEKTTEDELMLATNSFLFLFNSKTGKSKTLIPPGWEEGDWAIDLQKDSKGNIWIGATSDIYQYNTTTQNFTSPFHQKSLAMPVQLYKDEAGNIWMASHGLARYNTRTHDFDKIIDSFAFIKMPDKQINSFTTDGQGNVWINTNNNGLIQYNIQQQQQHIFTNRDGLPDNNISSMIVVGKNLWLACYSGIACMNIQTKQIISFGKEDGFPDIPISKLSNFVYDSTSNVLYICFVNTVARFNIDSLLKKKSSPALFIESVVTNEGMNFFHPGKSITTSWRDNGMMIKIGSINFLDGNSQAFAYRFTKESTTPWVQLASQSSFNISNLPPGSHTLEVKCFSVNNSWQSTTKEITIVVLPPFWMQGWFIVLMIFTTGALIYLFARWRISQVRKREMEKTRIQKLKADDYKSQFELEQISNYFSSSLTGKKTEEEVLWDVTNNLIRKMSYEDCVIYLWDRDEKKMVQKAAYGPKGKPEIISTNIFEVLPGQGVVGHVIQTRKPLLIDDTRKDGRYRIDDAVRLSEVCVPIIHNNELLGVVDSEHSQPGYFGERDIKILTTIATLIGNKLKQIQSEQTLEVKQKELATINQQLAEARLGALQAQMNPHFVFNALNSIKRMILDNDSEKASRYLSKFAQMIRMTLDQSKDTFFSLDENIQYLRSYLEMEQLRFDDTFKYKIRVEEDIDIEETAFPSLMIQPLAENAIWHGLMPSPGIKEITIQFCQKVDKISCIIEDNGIGIHASEENKKMSRSAHRSVGLENLQKRIKIINEKYRAGCTLDITDLKATDKTKSGTRVVLQLNMINI